MMALEEIKKALKGVTPGPWHVYSEKVADKAAAIAESAYQVEHTEPFVGEIFMLNAGCKCPALTGCGPCSEANANYIAAVNPVAITQLLYTIESLQRENEELWAEAKREAKLATHMANDCNDSQAEVKRLREALEFYAAQTHWSDGKFVQDEEPNVVRAVMSTIDSDNGKVARKALASTGGEHHAE